MSVLRIHAIGIHARAPQELVLFLASKDGVPNLKAAFPVSTWRGHGKTYRSQDGFFDEKGGVLRHKWDADEAFTEIEWLRHRIPWAGQPLTFRSSRGHGITYHLTIRDVAEVDACGRGLKASMTPPNISGPA